MSCIIIGVDTSDCSAHALEWALEEAALRDLPLHVVHAWEMPDSATADMESVLDRPNGPSGPSGPPIFHLPQRVEQPWARRDEIEGHAHAMVEELVAKA